MSTPPKQTVTAASSSSAAPPPVPQDDESRARAFVAKIVAGDYDGAIAMFDDTMRGALPKDKLTSTWEGILKSAGAFKSVDGVEVKPHDALKIALVKATFDKAPLVLRVVFDAQNRVAGFFVAPGDTAADWKAPSYADPSTFDEAKVTVGKSPALPGTWTTPKTGKPYPAVVLVHGSGPNDQDETIQAYKIFKDLAWGLATRGVAVLRYEKRTRIDPTGVRTQKEEVEDAANDAVAFVASQPDVDKKRVVLLGHSQGAYLAPRIAKNNPTLRGIVVLAGPTRALEDLLLEQLHYMDKLTPNDPQIQAAITAADQFKKDVENPALKPEDPIKIPMVTSTIPGAYFLDMRTYHPEKVAAGLSIPMLVLQGESDYQVTLKGDFPGWKTALASKKNATLKTYPKLNHGFSFVDGVSTPADYSKPGHVDGKVVSDIADWVRALPLHP